LGRSPRTTRSVTYVAAGRDPRIGAAAARTQRIRLTSPVTVLSAEDPVRPAFRQTTGPGDLLNVDSMVEDSTRVADSGGWGYAMFDYNGGVQ